MQIFVFGYGSLMNPKSVIRTLSGERATKRATLAGYQRRINVPYGKFLYLNIVPRTGKSVTGVLIPVTTDELEILKIREIGYACTDVTSQIGIEDVHVYTFVAPDIPYKDLKVPRSYLNTCLGGVEPNAHESWLAETIIENEIEEDALDPVYENTPAE